MTIAELNALDRDSLVAAIGHLFEHSPWVAGRAWERRPFADADALHAALAATMYEASPGEKLALIRAHPDLVGRAARAGTLTPSSTGEQAAAGLGALSPEEVALFDRYNGEYRDTFGFPFVICARENRKESILRAFPERLRHSREEEVATALAEIAKIARLRLLDVLSSEPSPA